MVKRYAVAELFYTLQGEGTNTGTPAVFVRFAGCNLWTGREQDRADAICQFCDVPALEVAEPGIAGRTTFARTQGPNGGKYTALALAMACRTLAPDVRLVVLTGGEPMLQLDEDLTNYLRAVDFRVALETNGSLPVPAGLVDFITVSPKAHALWVQRTGDDLRLVYPQEGQDPEDVFVSAVGGFTRYLLSPMEPYPSRDPDLWRANIEATRDYVLAHPHWHLSLQTHKYLNLA